MLQRSLGHYERFSLARHNVGHAPSVAFTAQIASRDALVISALDAAIRSLLLTEPLLSSSIADSRTEDPKYLRHSDVRSEKVLVELDTLGESTEQALLGGIQAMNDLDIEKAPLWRVFVYQPQPETRKRRIVVATHHVLCDGSAARNLFVELLTLFREPPSTSELVPDPLFPPTLEETVNVKPSKWLTLRTIFSVFIAPRIPSFLYTRPLRCWPNPALVAPINQPTALRAFSLPRDLSLALATISKTHDVKTLQPVFITAATSAIANVVLRRQSDPTSPSPPILIASQSPVSLRSPSLGHISSLTGNYISSISHSNPPLSLSILSTTSFWSSARSYSEFSKLPSTQQLAKEGMGLLGYLPSGLSTDDTSTGGRTPTMWEKHLYEQMEKDPNPWRGESFEVSNLGRIGEVKGWEGGGVEEVCWAQPGSGTGIGVIFNMVSFGGVLSWTVTWRKDTIDTDTVEEIAGAFETILTRIAKGEVGKDTKLDELLT
ncbi:hypothetical protein JCM16303_001370 [Sporobolomyces ruberrimus]